MKDWIIFKRNVHNPESEILYNNLNQKNKQVLDNWLYEKTILSKCPKRAGNRKRAIIKLLAFVDKDWDNMNYQDYVSVASAIARCDNGVKSKNGDRDFVKRFLKDNFEDCDTRFKKLELLKVEQEGEENKLTSNDLLTELEFDKLMKQTSDMKKISLIAVLYMSAGRPEEILKLKWSDVDFSKKQISLYSGKTKKRRQVYIDNVIDHLERLKKETGANDEDLIFPSVRGGKMTIAGLNFLLQELGRKAEIKKRIFAYLFRHTRLSCLITKLSPKVYEEVAGHSLQMGMKTYAHLNQDEILKEMKGVFEVEELTKEEKNQLKKVREELLELKENSFSKEDIRNMIKNAWKKTPEQSN